jgi:ABC-type multidrug transport system fused ATPase/permease subunit
MRRDIFLSAIRNVKLFFHPARVSMRRYLKQGYREKNISLSGPKGQFMGKKKVAQKSRLEQHYDNVMSKITAWEQDRSSGSQIVPWILLILGAFVTTLGIFYGIFRGSFTIGMIIVIIGILMIILAWQMSKKRSKGAKTIDDKIISFKHELFHIEKEG